MVKFNVNLSPTSIQNLSKKLKNYALEFENVKTEIVEALTDYVYERIMAYVPVDTGTLKASFMKEVSGNIGRVYTDLYYAKYVEFGTGVRGSSSEYDFNKLQISDAWSDYDENYGGQEAQEFMYKAVQDLETNYISIARNILKQKGLI